jgi:1-deoxy-D-xylulose-5-phosphate synthase
VVFVLDRAGVTGDDGASHNGMWDLSLLGMVPGISIAAPRDEVTLRDALRTALGRTDGPAVLRFPKGPVPAQIPAVRRLGTTDVLAEGSEPNVLVVGVGPMVSLALQVAVRAEQEGIGVTVVDPRWLAPVDGALVELARDYRLVVTIEDNNRVGGYGAQLAQALHDADVDVRVRNFGIPAAFLEHAKRDELLTTMGLTAQDIGRQVVEMFAGLVPPVPESRTADAIGTGAGPAASGGPVGGKPLVLPESPRTADSADEPAAG